MCALQTAERVSGRDVSDNYVFQRSLLAYHYAAERVSGVVLEIGTGSGYGVEVIAPRAERKNFARGFFHTRLQFLFPRFFIHLVKNRHGPYVPPQ